MFTKAHARSLAAALLCCAISTWARAANDDVVQMPRFEVREVRGYFEAQFEIDDATKKVKAGIVVWVSPSTYQKGLRRGDRLVSIDGKAITELRFQEVADFLNLKAGDSRVIMLAGRRGLLRKGVTPQMTITFIAGEKEPNKAPEPTP